MTERKMKCSSLTNKDESTYSSKALILNTTKDVGGTSNRKRDNETITTRACKHGPNNYTMPKPACNIGFTIKIPGKSVYGYNGLYYPEKVS